MIPRNRSAFNYVPPGGPGYPWYRRYWGYSNRPYGGCGCLWALLVFLLIWWLLAFLIPELAIWAWYW